MLRASALNLVIVIALVVGILCAALVSLAYFYRQQHLQALRYDTLSDNVTSGINILLVDNSADYEDGRQYSLFDGTADSVWLKKMPWGIYDVGVSRAFVQQDTLTSVFSIGYMVDSTKWAALYLPDEDRPVSLSGKTTIRGTAFLPKSGVRAAYIDGKAYDGDKRLVIGRTSNSERQLPPLSPMRLSWLTQKSTDGMTGGDRLPTDSLSRSFIQDTKVIFASKAVLSLDNIQLNGNIIIRSDTTVIIGQNARLNGVLIFAPYIKVKKGFSGNCQLFALDSVRVETGVRLDYPSSIGVLRSEVKPLARPAELSIDSGAYITGCVFAYDKNTARDKQPIVRLGKNVIISGQVYSPGLLQINDGVKVNGSVFTARFLYKAGFTIFENYVVNTTIDMTALTRYYLASELIPVTSKKKKVLQWLEKK